MKSPLVLALFTLSLLLTGRPTAQTFRSTTALVNVSATVLDRGGRVMTGLRKEDFSLSEDGEPQEIAIFHADTDTPLSVALVVDTSGSMVDKMDNVHDALGHFVTLLRDDDDVFLVRFSDTVELVASADNRDRLHAQIARLYASGGTALFDGVEAGAEAVRRGRHPKRVVVLVTDGNDTTSRTSRRDAGDSVARAETLLYGVGIGHGERGSFGHGLFGGGQDPFGSPRMHADRVDAGVLKDLAEPTGGRAYVLEQAHRDGRDLIDEAMQEIARELRQQYTLGYYPANTELDGKFRRISVETKDRSLKVRARRGYWARGKDTRERFEAPPSTRY